MVVLNQRPNIGGEANLSIDVSEPGNYGGTRRSAMVWMPSWNDKATIMHYVTYLGSILLVIHVRHGSFLLIFWEVFKGICSHIMFGSVLGGMIERSKVGMMILRRRQQKAERRCQQRHQGDDRNNIHLSKTD
jgi:hypothetical protein